MAPKRIAESRIVKNYPSGADTQSSLPLFNFERPPYHQSTLIRTPQAGTHVVLQLVQSNLFSRLPWEELSAERLWCNTMLYSASYPSRTSQFYTLRLLLSLRPLSKPPSVFATLIPARLSSHIQRYIKKTRPTSFVSQDCSSFVDYDIVELVQTQPMDITTTCHREFSDVLNLNSQSGTFHKQP